MSVAEHEAAAGGPLENVVYEVKKVVVGQDVLLERLAVALLARGHVLVEGVPGLAKTLTVNALARAIGGSFQRIQFTPDLMPADVSGTRVFDQRTGGFEVVPGPVFANLLLADEINRAPAKVQSALLEVMQERQVTIGRETFPVPDPFLVLATQNPIESDGTYPLPEAQLDRFLFNVLVDYPQPHEEFVVVERALAQPARVEAVLDPARLAELQRRADAVYVDPALIDYAVRVVHATRHPAAAGLPDLADHIAYGAGPRASIGAIVGARALAFLRGRDYAIVDDIADLLPDVLRHRIVLTYRAAAEGVAPDEIVRRVLAAVPAPVPVAGGR
ncbi:MAG: AAA family ATPase [Microbacterium sp.]